MRLIFTGGGTGGHVNPAVAMATAMLDKHPDCEVLFIGRSGGGENRAVSAAGLKDRGDQLHFDTPP